MRYLAALFFAWLLWLVNPRISIVFMIVYMIGLIIWHGYLFYRDVVDNIPKSNEEWRRREFGED